MSNKTNIVLEALKEVKKTQDICSGKGGFFIKGEGFMSLAQARKVTGIKAEKRNFRPVMSAYGDWAMVAKINRIK